MAFSRKVAAGLLQLEEMTRAGLAARWTAQMKVPPPKAASRIFLLRALSYELQCLHAPDLSKADQKALKLGACKNGGGGEADAKASPAGDQALVANPIPSPPRLSLVPGSRLVREWNGKAYTVAVIEEGFVYKDRIWTSLSAIAKDITGAHWSGPRFFGLKRSA